MNKFGRIRHFKQSGARLYIPESILSDNEFPFLDGEIVKIEISNGGLKVQSVEWWEMLDSRTLSRIFNKLPDPIKEKVRLSGCVQGE